MAELEYFVVAESVSVDQLTNRVSIFNVYEELNVPAFPYQLPQLVAVCSWNTTPEDEGQDFQVSLIIHTPAGEELGRYASNFTASAKRQRTFQMFQGLAFAEPGTFRFEIKLNETHAANHTIDIKQLEK